MNKYLPLILIIAVLLLGAAGFFYVSSQKNASSVHTAADISSPSPASNINDLIVKKETTLIAPTESVIASMIPLSVSAPTNGSRTTSAKIQVIGKTVPNAEVFVNDVGTKADLSGNFKASLTLDEGDNYILVFVNDENGNYAQQEMTVTYVMP